MSGFPFASYQPETFKFDTISGGVRLSCTSGVWRPWISFGELLGMAYAMATARGGRLEVEGDWFTRSISRAFLKRHGAVRIVNTPGGRDVYLLARGDRQ